VQKHSFEINKKTLQLIEEYLLFQISNGFPSREYIQILINSTGVSFTIKPPTPTVPISSTENTVTNNLVYKRISTETDYSKPILRYKSAGLFECYSEKINNFFTGSTPYSHSKYYLPVYSENPNTINAEHILDVCYAHISGSGSSYIIDKWTDLVPAKSLYRQYMLNCFDTNKGKFKFKNDKNGDYFYVLNFDTNLIKDRLDPGNFELLLSPLSSSANQLVNTGSNFYANPSSSVIYSLIDDSGDGSEQTLNEGEIRDYYYLVSGSLIDGVYGESTDDAWGMIFPRLGFVILDGTVLDTSCSFNTVTASIDGDNMRKLFVSISGSCSPNVVRQTTGSLFGRSTTTTISEAYFCRVDRNEFNYSTNPTYTDSTTNKLKYNSFSSNPRVYITTIGLYNFENELVAIGKLPKPILKTKDDEHVFQIRVRLN